MENMCDHDQERGFPQTWAEFSGKHSGRSYVIKDAEVRHYDAIKKAMARDFLADEPTCKYQNCHEDTEFISELNDVWSSCLRENLSIVCLTEENIAGFILLSKATKNQQSREPVNQKWAKICDIMAYLTKQADPRGRLKIDEYLTDLGLLVLPKYRGDGIAEKLLNVCDDVSRFHSLPATIMTFSSYVSQKLALKIGYSELLSVPYATLRALDEEKFGISGIEQHTKDIKYMYMLYGP